MKERRRMEKQIEKQAIEEMAKVIERTEQIARDNAGAYPSPTMFAKDLYWHGCRKQIEGVWVGKTDYAGYGYYCSKCSAVFTGENAEWIAKEHHYCPKCGAKMKGENK